jgi:hypothetical protein
MLVLYGVLCWRVAFFAEAHGFISSAQATTDLPLYSMGRTIAAGCDRCRKSTAYSSTATLLLSALRSKIERQHAVGPEVDSGVDNLLPGSPAGCRELDVSDLWNPGWSRINESIQFEFSTKAVLRNR